MSPRTEPVVRIRCPPEEEARCLAALQRAGYAAERSLTWVVVRDAAPDAVNEALAAGGAGVRVAVRERIGQLVGWLIDRQGKLEGRAVNVQALVRRVLEDGGLTARYAPRPLPELLEPATRTYEALMASGAAQVTWDRFVEAFCVELAAPPAP
ncbi:hypothetical protein ACOQFB_17175 [Anaeromyxobacter sp. Red801]|uniref:hypothetical protein n=1 Tax=Anaeromyxobacter sp. Red801 TaxID=3411632 RepID=UPI003B9F8BF0